MIVETKSFQESCKRILDAVDSNPLIKHDMSLTDVVELKGDGEIFYLNVTNQEYYVSVKTNIEANGNLHAVVNAVLFLNLISKVTTPTIEMRIHKNSLLVKANGTYKFPLIYKDDEMVSVPKLEIRNKTNEFDILISVLQSILKYNSKEMLKSGKTTPAHNLYYIDNKGAITFGNGACINKFTLEHPVVMVLPDKIVKMFKLFKSSQVKFAMGFDLVGKDELVTKVMFKDEQVTLVAILNTKDNLINSFPVTALRQQEESNFKHTATINRNAVLDALERMVLFTRRASSLGVIQVEFSDDQLSFIDEENGNKEEVKYIDRSTNIDPQSPYKTTLNAEDLKITLETLKDQYLMVMFGNHTSVAIKKGNIINIIQEVR